LWLKEINVPQCTAESSVVAAMTLGGGVGLVVIGVFLWMRYGTTISAWGKNFRSRQFNLAKEGE
jgi:hypothetical protein